MSVVHFGEIFKISPSPAPRPPAEKYIYQTGLCEQNQPVTLQDSDPRSTPFLPVAFRLITSIKAFCSNTLDRAILSRFTSCFNERKNSYIGEIAD